jgi:uncharacterized protein YbbC (DUF1343 family)
MNDHYVPETGFLRSGNEGRMAQSVRIGVDRLAVGAAELPRSARLGLLTNRAARTSAGEWTGSVLVDAGYRLALFLTPEHGLAVDAAAGAPVGHSQFGSIPVLSLYGADTSPVEAALKRSMPWSSTFRMLAAGTIPMVGPCARF